MADVTRARAASILVTAPRATIVRMFGALVCLQPIRWTHTGLICAPWLAGLTAERCPLPFVAVAVDPVVPDTHAAMVSGWYRRSDRHAPAPPGVRELVQTTGEGFGPADHPTTAMCLRAIDALPPGRALDVGCGSGLLAQAWAASGHGPVTAIDADSAAVRQAAASALAADLGQVEVTHGRIEALPASSLAGTSLLANLPPGAHDLLAARIDTPPRVAVLSGFGARDRVRVLAPYRARGMRPVRAMRAGRFECHVLVAA